MGYSIKYSYTPPADDTYVLAKLLAKLAKPLDIFLLPQPPGRMQDRLLETTEISKELLAFHDSLDKSYFLV